MRNDKTCVTVHRQFIKLTSISVGGIAVFMSRPWRIEFEEALYHIFSRGNEQRDIFLDDDYLAGVSRSVGRLWPFWPLPARSLKSPANSS